MIKNICLGVLIILSIQSLYAQDSLRMHFDPIKERTSLINEHRNTFYRSPSSKPFLYEHSLTPIQVSYGNEGKDVFNLQDGSGVSGFKFNTSSYLKNQFPDITLWGNATYENLKVKDIKFNETSDYDLLFPYLTADSVGGNVFQENYSFGGGLAKTKGKWVYGGGISYRANQSYRRVDPRQSNVSSDLMLEAGASYQILPNYIIDASAKFNYYKQDNKVVFNKLLGRPALYYLNGLGTYNQMMAGFTGSTASIFYELYAAEGKLAFLPKKATGLYFETYLKQYLGHRILPRSAMTANEWSDIHLGGKGGYINLDNYIHYGVLAALNLQTKKGKEGLFANDGVSSGYTKISEKSTYRYYDFEYQLELLVGQKDWTIKPYAEFQQIKEQYVSPFREQKIDALKLGAKAQYLMELNEGLLGISLNLQKKKIIQKHSTFNAIREDSGLSDLLKLNYQYLTAEPFAISAEIRYDVKLSKQIKPYLIANASTASEIKQKSIGIAVGLLF